LEIVAAAEALLRDQDIRHAGLPLSGKHVLITSGPTHEPIDPVRYIANRSSGKQGHALARAAFDAGARVTLVSGPVDLPDPANVTTVHVETAAEMLKAVEASLPADIAIMAAAVADWRVAAEGSQKIKKDGSGQPPALALVENPDILATIGHHRSLRPQLLIGFAAETQNLIDNARAKLERKKADWIIANDVSPQTGIMGGDANTVRLVSRSGVEDWPEMNKADVARQIIERAAQELRGDTAL
ncbi:MAG: phosphopantothenoylcysteine decarboxylase, partial [Pseudomonadota bacterium]